MYTRHDAPVKPGETKQVRISAELFTIPLDDGKSIVYAPLRRAAFVANNALVDFVAVLQETKVIDDTADPDGRVTEFLRNLEIVDGGDEHRPVTEFAGEPEPTTVTLFLTTACNLRCTYCYAAAGDTPTKFMSLDVARRGIDFIAANARRKGAPEIEITYHGGGEPTLHWRVVTESLEYAREVASRLELRVKAFSATNGVIDDSQINWIIQNLNGLSVSFDGLPSAQDKHRLTVLGQGSSAQVERSLRRFDEAGFPYGIRVTVTADQIAKLSDSIRHICSNFNAQRVQVEPAYQLGRWNDAASSESGNFIEAFRAADLVAKEYGRSLFYSAARVGALTNHFCSITQDSFALSPDGNVSACYEVFSEDNPLSPSFFYGRPSGGGYKFNLPVLNNLRRQAVQHREFCSGCFAKWTCAGDCYHKSLTVNGPGEFAGSDRCHITRELTKDQILAKIAHSGGLFWHEGAQEQSSVSASKEVLS
jgi:radical SAM additional 4Fe4S-binding domain